MAPGSVGDFRCARAVKINQKCYRQLSLNTSSPRTPISIDFGPQTVPARRSWAILRYLCLDDANQIIAVQFVRRFPFQIHVDYRVGLSNKRWVCQRCSMNPYMAHQIGDSSAFPYGSPPRTAGCNHIYALLTSWLAMPPFAFCRG